MWVQNPFLIKAARLPFPLASFIGNSVSVVLLNFLVPFASGRLGWWLSPSATGRRGSTLAGAALVAALYAACIALFIRLS